MPGVSPAVPPTSDPRRRERRRLIHDVWPDKRLYGCVLLFVAGLSGILYGLLLDAAPVQFGGNVPNFLVTTSTGWLLFASALVVLFAWTSLHRRRSTWGFVAAAIGVVSLGFLGIETLLSLIAVAFLVMSRVEGEDDSEETRNLDVRMWPDKSLAASLLALVGAVVALAWGAALLGGDYDVGAWTAALGLAALVTALVGLVAAWRLYHQSHPWLGVLAAALDVATFPFFVVGPLIAVAMLVLIRMAAGEDEFAEPAAAG